VSAWLHRIGRDACIDESRRRQRYRLQWHGLYDRSSPIERGSNDPLRTVIDREEDATLPLTLRCLPPRQRWALVLHMYEGMSHEEIGAMLDVRRAAVKGIISRARGNPQACGHVQPRCIVGWSAPGRVAACPSPRRSLVDRTVGW
jgi:RNA polymerase sigma factor (sigma-70 family)